MSNPYSNFVPAHETLPFPLTFHYQRLPPSVAILMTRPALHRLPLPRHSFLLAACAALCAACSGEAPTPKAGTRNTAVPVLTVPVVKKNVPLLLPAIGSVQARTTVTVRPQVSGSSRKSTLRKGLMSKQGICCSRSIADHLKSPWPAPRRNSSRRKPKPGMPPCGSSDMTSSTAAPSPSSWWNR